MLLLLIVGLLIYLLIAQPATFVALFFGAAVLLIAFVLLRTVWAIVRALLGADKY